MIDRSVHLALNDEGGQAAFDLHMERMRDLFSGRSLDSVFLLNGIGRYTERDDVDWEEWLDESLDYLAEKTQEARNREVFRPLTVTYNPYGVHFVDKLFGAEVFALETGWQVRPLASPVGTLQRPDIEAHPVWRAARDYALAFSARDVANVTMGLPTIANALNIAVNLYGQEILLALVADPEAAHRDLRIINDVLCSLHELVS